MHPGTSGVSADANPGFVTEPQERIGRYDLVRRLGSGGMAEVHLARASGIEGFEKLVVLKRILPGLAADPHFVQMFLGEARLAAILDHPNVVQVFDLGRDGDDFYFTMEFVYGETVHAAIKAARRAGEQFPIELAIAIAVGAASGLHYAHERVGFDGQPLNIVHRDVSPTNVMVTYHGCVKVADFGIAKVANRTDVTRAGMRKGKVPYMSPEQCRAEKLDRRSDVFALGIVLYEASTMERLFDGDNEFGVMNRIVNGDIPLPSTRRSGYPKELERIVMKALSVDRNKRYASAREMLVDLEQFARERKLEASPASLGQWMHRMFRPKPFPWGALQGTNVLASSPGMSTLADAAFASYPASRPGMPGSHQDLTPASHASWPPTTRGSIAVHRTKSGGVLKPISIGLGVLAAAAAIAVGGMVIHAKVIAPSSGSAPVDAPPAVPVAVPVAPPIAPEAAVVEEREVPVEGEAPAVEQGAAEHDESALEESAESEPEKRRATSTRGKGSKPKASTEKAKPKTDKPKTDKPKTDKPKPKSGKTDIDAFWPGG
jgi:serine/threonine protein kinase